MFRFKKQNSVNKERYIGINLHKLRFVQVSKMNWMYGKQILKSITTVSIANIMAIG